MRDWLMDRVDDVRFRPLPYALAACGVVALMAVTFVVFAFVIPAGGTDDEDPLLAIAPTASPSASASGDVAPDAEETDAAPDPGEPPADPREDVVVDAAAQLLKDVPALSAAHATSEELLTQANPALPAVLASVPAGLKPVSVTFQVTADASTGSATVTGMGPAAVLTLNFADDSCSVSIPFDAKVRGALSTSPATPACWAPADVAPAASPAAQPATSPSPAASAASSSAAPSAAGSGSASAALPTSVKLSDRLVLAAQSLLSGPAGLQQPAPDVAAATALLTEGLPAAMDAGNADAEDSESIDALVGELSKSVTVDRAGKRAYAYSDGVLLSASSTVRMCAVLLPFTSRSTLQLADVDAAALEVRCMPLP